MLDTYTPPAVKEIMGQYTPVEVKTLVHDHDCLLYTSPSPRDMSASRMPSSA